MFEVTLEDRVGLTERECRAWITRLRFNRRSAKSVADELEGALEAALDAGLVLAGETVTIR